MLTGVRAGKRNKAGHFPKDSVHARVEAKMKATAEGLDGDKRDHDEDDRLDDAKKNEDEEAPRENSKFQRYNQATKFFGGQ